MAVQDWEVRRRRVDGAFQLLQSPLLPVLRRRRGDKLVLCVAKLLLDLRRPAPTGGGSGGRSRSAAPAGLLCLGLQQTGRLRQPCCSGAAYCLGLCSRLRLWRSSWRLLRPGVCSMVLVSCRVLRLPTCRAACTNISWLLTGPYGCAAEASTWQKWGKEGLLVLYAIY